MKSTPQTPNRLQNLCDEHIGKVSDKWESYIDIYDELFQEIYGSVESILEIGIQNGGSLEIWSSYFPVARKIFGIDINPKCKLLKFKDERIKVFVGDANTREMVNMISEGSTFFDIIIDDGSHVSSDIIRTFALYFPKLKSGGTYIIEDLHASYWESHQGALNYNFSSIEFLKKLVDVVNFSHWGTDMSPSEILQSFINLYNLDLEPDLLLSIGSVYFQDSICVITKSSPAENPLGVRRIFGKDASIDDSVISFNHSTSATPTQYTNSLFNLFVDDELILKFAQNTAELTTKIENIEDELRVIKSSASWRYTKKLRQIRYLMSKFSQKK
ncbi:methyltransferase [Candidatus Planktophila limnetica]|uniref:Methyltransferase n=1 Tax=Candidatus Planktophila limnetica TaxID=573600 RepID=A0A249LH63_9ACTN|nr:class I SAM-dependent methyltransferase [Candidatus Planktophila limnetica]ASY28274.1 methyltransferase [Candidatus Planktophila limnetica]